MTIIRQDFATASLRARRDLPGPASSSSPAEVKTRDCVISTTIEVGSTYNDLGATAKDAQGHDLGLKYFLNGSLVSNIVVNTSEVATNTIDYVAIDTDGLTATSTRQVIIVPASLFPSATDTSASTTTASADVPTEASSTPQ